jgi:hypothetical protein
LSGYWKAQKPDAKRFVVYELGGSEMKLILVLIANLLVLAAFAQKPVQVKVEDHVVTFDAEPREVRGVTMVPIRSMVEAMGGTMRWDLSNRTVTVWKGGNRFNIVLNSRSATVNEKAVSMEEASLIYKNRIYVPLKFVADASGYLISMEDGWYVLRPVRG